MYKEADNKKVSILGTEYEISFVSADSDILVNKDADGYTDVTTKQLFVGIFEPDVRSVADLDAYQKRIMRHEIIHAFFYESGLWVNSSNSSSWALNEEMVDWLAIQHSKLHAVFEKVGAL